MQLTKWKPMVRGLEADHTGISLNDDDFDRVLEITKDLAGLVTFREACDGYYCISMPKEEAKRALLEALAWLEN